MQVLFSFFKKKFYRILLDSLWTKRPFSSPSKEPFQKKTGYRPQKRNDTLLYDSFICECRGCAA